MKVTVSTNSNIYVLDVAEDLELENFHAFCEVESGIPADQIIITFKGTKLLEKTKTLKDYGLRDNDLVNMERKPRGSNVLPAGLNLDFSSISIPASSMRSRQNTTLQERKKQEITMMRDQLLADPYRMALIKQNNPPLADALVNGGIDKFTQVLESQLKAETEKKEKLSRALANSNSAEAQAIIAEEIRKKNVEANFNAAMEYNPEMFGDVCMLYINCKVNGHSVKAFVDSGAQMTIMSANFAKKCNLMSLVDTRWAGLAKGIGTQNILGRIHMTQLQIGQDFLTCSFSILEGQKIDMLLGLDMLKRHQCSIDLRRNVLVIGTSGAETRFLPESEIPKSFDDEDEDNLKKTLETSAMEVDKGSNFELISSMAPQASKATTSSALDSAFPESTVSEMVAMNFPRDNVIRQLRRFNGDKTQAIAALFAESLKF